MSEQTEIVRALIRDKAAAAHAQYPQYEGHWDGPEWMLVRVNRNVRTKMGQAFEKGELTIAKRVEDDVDLSDGYFAYSVSNGIDTWLKAAWVEVF